MERLKKKNLFNSEKSQNFIIEQKILEDIKKSINGSMNQIHLICGYKTFLTFILKLNNLEANAKIRKISNRLMLER